MAITSAQVEQAAERWGLGAVAGPHLDRLAAYGNLLLHWNTRLSLTAIRDEWQLIERHLMEGVFAAAHHPAGATALDFGSGTGIPGVVIAICCPEAHVTLAESQRKKAAFLAEVSRQLHLGASVHASRAEILPAMSFDTVWMRAVDKSDAMFPAAAGLIVTHGALCVFGTESRPESDSIRGWRWKTYPFPGQNSRVLHIGHRA